MTDRRDLSQDADIQAAELAFGLLEGDALLEAQRREQSDAEFARRVQEWHLFGLEELSETIPEPIGARNRVWSRLGASLGEVSSEPEPDRRRSAGGWQMTAIAASIAAALFVGLWLFETRKTSQLDTRLAALVERQNQPTDLSALRVAKLNGANAEHLLAAVFDESEGKLTVRIEVESRGELVPELWVIGRDSRPRSLGQSATGSTIVLDLSPEMRREIAAGGSLALSLEEASDRPHEQPTPETVLGATKLEPLI